MQNWGSASDEYYYDIEQNVILKRMPGKASSQV